jgi:hypothetical protein
VLQQAAEGERGRADAGGEPGLVEIVGFPAEGGAEPVEGADEVRCRSPRVIVAG